MPSLKIVLVLCMACILIGCDPLAPNATPVVIVITQTPVPTRTSPPLPTQTATKLSLTSVPIVTTEAATVASDEPPATESGCTQVKGQIVDLSFDSKILKAPMVYRAYLPPCYGESTRRYPYVILMPGSDKDETEWTDMLKANQALEVGLTMQALPPMLLIMPRGGDLMNLNIF